MEEIRGDGGVLQPAVQLDGFGGWAGLGEVLQPEAGGDEQVSHPLTT